MVLTFNGVSVHVSTIKCLATIVQSYLEHVEDDSAFSLPLIKFMAIRDESAAILVSAEFET